MCSAPKAVVFKDQICGRAVHRPSEISYLSSARFLDPENCSRSGQGREQSNADPEPFTEITMESRA